MDTRPPSSSQTADASGVAKPAAGEGNDGGIIISGSYGSKVAPLSYALTAVKLLRIKLHRYMVYYDEDTVL